MYNASMGSVGYQRLYPYYHYQASQQPLVAVGQNAASADPTQQPADPNAPLDWSAVDALKRITPTLLIVGIATGAAFAIGSGLVSRYLFRDGRR